MFGGSIDIGRISAAVRNLRRCGLEPVHQKDMVGKRQSETNLPLGIERAQRGLPHAGPVMQRMSL